MIQFYFKTFKASWGRNTDLNPWYMSHRLNKARETKQRENDHILKTNISHIDDIFWGFALKMTTNLDYSRTLVFPLSIVLFPNHWLSHQQVSDRNSQIRAIRIYCNIVQLSLSFFCVFQVQRRAALTQVKVRL